MDVHPFAVIIVNWNTAPDVAELLESLPEAARGRAVVVDNGSRDPQREHDIIAPEVRRAVYLKLDVNGGYGAGMNAGLEYAHNRGDRTALLVNPDARPSSAAIDRVLSTFPGPAIAGVRQYEAAGEEPPPWRSEYPTAAVGAPYALRSFTCHGCPRRVHAVSVVSGALLAVDVPVVLAAGGFDTDYFHYQEETDLCLRVGAAGGGVVWRCDTAVPHRRGASLARSSATATYYRARNEILLHAKVGAGHRVMSTVRALGAEASHFRSAVASHTVAHWAVGVRDGLARRGGPRK